MKLSPDFRRRTLAGEWLTGTFLNLGSPMTVEIAGLAGFDWLLIDHEHGPGGADLLLHQLHAAAQHRMPERFVQESDGSVIASLSPGAGQW